MSHLLFRVSAVALMAAAAVALPSAPLRAQNAEAKAEEAPDRAAERLNEEGKKLVAAGRYEDALEKFRASLKHFPLSNAIFNVGSMLYTLKQMEEAFPYLEYTLRAPLDPRQREIVLQYRENVINQLKGTHAVILVETSPPGASVALNNKLLPFETPMRVIVPLGAADLTLSTPGFKPVTKVVNGSLAEPPKDLRVRLERDDPDAPVTVFCPKGADVFIDGQMMGVEVARVRLLVGPHVIRCGKTALSKAFEREAVVRPGTSANVFEYSNFKQ
jgi:hypothetical protein